MDFDASQILGSNQLYQMSRDAEGHGLWHLGTCGQVTSSASLAIPVAAIPAGAAIVNGTVQAAVAGANVSLTAAHATLPRRDVIWVDSGGTLGKTDGTAATNPAPPALTAARLALAEIYVAANATSIATGDITDKRQVLSGTRFIPKLADETVANSASLQNDNHLFFSVFPNEKWEFEIEALCSINTTEGFRFGFTFPASAVVDGSMILGANALVPATSVYLLGGASGVTLLSLAQIAGYFRFRGVFINSSTAGTFQLQWAQGTSGAGTTTIKGHATNPYTFMLARKIY